MMRRRRTERDRKKGGTDRLLEKDTDRLLEKEGKREGDSGDERNGQGLSTFPKTTLQLRRTDDEDAMFFYFNYVQRRQRRDVDDVVTQFGSGRREDAMLIFLEIRKPEH